MSAALDQIKAPIAEELKLFEQKFRDSMRSKVALLDTVMNYIVKRKGKQMRPLLVMHCAKLFGDINEKTYRGASLVELLHTATLVHDDVVDDASKRRGYFSINALWKNKIAVLVGDYLLSKGLLLALRNKDHDSLEILSDAVEQMSEGELLQMEKARKLDITEEVYFDIITKKTASLLASCCAIGANSTCEDGEVVGRVREMGLKLGIAFQIKDDLFDYGDNNVGKPTGIDIVEKKMTLPLIHALSKANAGDQRKIRRLVKKDRKSKQEIKYVIQFVLDNGGMEYATDSMNRYKEEAVQILEGLPATSSNASLRALIDYVIERRK